MGIGVGGGILIGTKSSCGQKMAGAPQHIGVEVGVLPLFSSTDRTVARKDSRVNEFNVYGVKT